MLSLPPEYATRCGLHGPSSNTVKRTNRRPRTGPQKGLRHPRAQRTGARGAPRGRGERGRIHSDHARGGDLPRPCKDTGSTARPRPRGAPPLHLLDETPPAAAPVGPRSAGHHATGQSPCKPGQAPGRNTSLPRRSPPASSAKAPAAFDSGRTESMSGFRVPAAHSCTTRHSSSRVPMLLPATVS
jgi:hypothetical protein